jgi:hypothetical protein
MAVIVLGAAYVCYGMFVQTPPDSSPMPSVHTLNSPYRLDLSAKQNPYIAALLAPAGSSKRIGETKRFSELLHKRLGEIDAKSKIDLSSIKPETDLLTKKDPITGMSVIDIAEHKRGSGLFAKSVDASAREHIDKLLGEIETAYQKGDTDLGLKQVSQALAAAQGTPELPTTTRIDIFLAGGKLSYRAGNFDQSRQYIDQAIALAHQNEDYKMDELEGLRCLLNGNGQQATDYNMQLSQFNEKLSQSDFDQLPTLADGLVAATKTLPDDSFFSLQAQLNRATAMLLTGAKPNQTELCIKKVESLAHKAHDQPIVANCVDLLVRLKRE